MEKKIKVAGGHYNTVDSAYNILKLGGNAFDAAIAGVFSLKQIEAIALDV